MKKKSRKLLRVLLLLTLPIFIFYLANFNLKGTFQKAIALFLGKTQTEQPQIPQAWLDKYALTLKDPAELKADIDNDGLDLLAEYQHATDPLNPDSDGDGFKDGQEVQNGFSPTGQGKLDQDQDNLPDLWEKQMGLSTKKKNYLQDPDGDGLPNYQEFAHQTNPLKQDSDGDGFGDAHEIKSGYDPSVSGTVRPQLKLAIQKIKLEAPIVWSKSMEEKNLLKDLEKGVARLPETGIPGQSGNTVISGHSSNYIWAKGDYNYIFENLNKLEVGDKIIIKKTQHNGQTFEHIHTVKSKTVVKPNDPLIFTDTKEPSITLVTCWPLHTTWKRLVIKAELEQ